jgi:hypothetical protein
MLPPQLLGFDGGDSKRDDPVTNPFATVSGAMTPAIRGSSTSLGSSGVRQTNNAVATLSFLADPGSDDESRHVVQTPTNHNCRAWNTTLGSSTRRVRHMFGVATAAAVAAAMQDDGDQR